MGLFGGGKAAAAAAAEAAAAAGRGGGLLSEVVEAVVTMAAKPATNGDWCVRAVACSVYILCHDHATTKLSNPHPPTNHQHYHPYRAAGAERLMFPVERYLWLFPNDVRKLVGGAQQREGCVLCN